MKAPLLVSAAALILAGCARTGEIDATGGITAIRSACPVVGVAAGTGDITLFDPPASQEADAIDVVGSITDVRGTCNESGDQIVTNVSFLVRASRTRATAARDVTLPFYVAIVRGGTQVTAKRISSVTVHFDAGQTRAEVRGAGTTSIARTAATLPQEIRDRLTRRRKAGEEDAATDPLAQPEVRRAVLAASFEALVGFQLTDAQLKYNATR